VVGPSGSGKTTLLQILGCLDVPTAGQYMLDGAHTEKMSDDQLSKLRNEKIGFVFQSFNLLPRTTALENVQAPFLYADQPIAAGQAEEMLERVGLSQRNDHYPSELSGGEQQRVGIARALIRDPRLLLADEPTGNLDAESSNEVLVLFEELNAQGLTIALVTHDKDVASRAHRTIQLKDGRIVNSNGGKS
jgi:putative ABC transport system ATP-binding protein